MKNQIKVLRKAKNYRQEDLMEAVKARLKRGHSRINLTIFQILYLFCLVLLVIYKSEV